MPKPGSLIILGHSGEERFGITDEARQLLSNLLDFAEAEEAVTGLVGKGLLVVPGQWARLSNISVDGKWLRTERFKIGSKEFVHFQGASPGAAEMKLSMGSKRIPAQWFTDRLKRTG